MAKAGDGPKKENFDIKDVESLLEYVKKFGLKGLYKEVKRRLDLWKNEPLDIGVLGYTGTGKSSFINTVRRVRACNQGAAATNVVEETKVPKPYEHRQNPNIKFWDLPGAGTKSFPRLTYLKQINFNIYHFFIIICSERFKEDDLWFANEVRTAKKRFYFVRTKIDMDVKNHKDDYPTMKPEQTLARVRGDITRQLFEGGFKDSRIFLVCKNPLLYDFPALEERLVTDLQELQKELYVLSMHTTSHKVIAKKTAHLLKRCWLEAAECLISGSKPVKKLSIILNAEKLAKKLRFYKEVYAVDQEGMKLLSDSTNVPEQILTDAIGQPFWLDVTEKTILDEMEKSRVEEYPEETLSTKLLDLPVIGFIFNCKRSYMTTKSFLESTIKSMELAAKSVLDKACQKTSGKQ